MFSVQEATREDEQFLVPLLRSLFEQEIEFSPNPSLHVKALKMILENESIGKIFVLKEIKEQKIVGMVSLLWSVSTALGGRVAFLEDMVIDPKWRGMGGGKQLLGDVIAYARTVSCHRITLLSDHDNLYAHAFYRSFGFVESSMKPFRLFLDKVDR